MKTKAYIQMALAMAIVGSSVVVGKIITESLPIFLASGASLFVASLIFVFLLYRSLKKIPRLGKKDTGIILLQAFLGTFLYRIFLLYGLKYTSASVSGIITSSGPAVFAIIAIVLLKEKLKIHQMIGVLISVIGVLLINVFGTKHVNNQGENMLIGNVLVFGGVIFESVFTIFAKLVSKKVTPLMISAYVTFFSFLMFLPFSIFEASKFNFATIQIGEVISVLYYGIFITVIAYLLWFKGFEKVEASSAGVFTGVIPVSALLLSYIILREEFTLVHILGALAVIVGIIFISKNSKRKKII